MHRKSLADFCGVDEDHAAVAWGCGDVEAEEASSQQVALDSIQLAC